MLPWILGGLIGATVTAVVFYNAEDESCDEDAHIDELDALINKIKTLNIDLNEQVLENLRDKTPVNRYLE
ncbi:hypothetical protein Sulku_2418 [Sulfuricurvum kujiense DSM 16994]|uniref:Uncharacterized protein n=1 Tax=Sulfuricurvum kujiense (strain ATCC BAA-921 / DSM 16994 / JCM 11577 / YK-1) TaxID=709032 RepID=E4TYD3_SULKY|nr:hypothetical protein [Sulfuricurvum kujiense]ADR35078.1 hypothetical protein Sulku_2418 [Sulfuricurvum kujiense DSM 16994]